MNELNLAEILRDCPQGTKLYSPICGECTFGRVNNDPKYPITIYATDKKLFDFTADGRYYYNADDTECLLFPSKDQRDWSKFQKSFKDGDIVVNASNEYSNAFIYAGENNLYYECYVGLTTGTNPELSTDKSHYWVSKKSGIRFATEEEKKKLFDAIKANGYKWNDETKTLEKLIEPKFKVGDRIKIVHKKDYRYIITQVTDTHYTIRETDEGFLCTEPISEDENWELVPNKFDINTLKVFDKVLVRDTKEQVWVADLFSHAVNRPLGGYTFACIGHYPNQCIPYEGNEHLLGTTDDCDEYYKTWEK